MCKLRNETVDSVWREFSIWFRNTYDIWAKKTKHILSKLKVPLSASVCFHQAWPNPDQQAPFPSIFCALYYSFSPISSAPSTLPLAFLPCHSGEWIIHDRAACWWRWNHVRRAGYTCSSQSDPSLQRPGDRAEGGAAVLLHGVLYRPLLLLRPGCITLPRRLSRRSHVSPSKPRHGAIHRDQAGACHGTLQWEAWIMNKLMNYEFSHVHN